MKVGGGGGSSSLYDLNYFEDEQQMSTAVTEVSQRARRRRKDTLDEMSAAELAQEAVTPGGRLQETSGEMLPGTGSLKRRNTMSRKGGSGGNSTADGVERSTKGSSSSGALQRQDKTSAASGKQDKMAAASAKCAEQQRKFRLGSELETAQTEEVSFKSSLLEKSSSLDTEDEEEEKLDEKNVTFCMWGHENCKTRSHYRYNWQWDYVQKYVDQHNKNMLSGYLPRDGDASRLGLDDKYEGISVKAGSSSKPNKEGIKVRLQMLQNRLTQGKTSDSVKQKMFERDLELEMLRRKKTYQF
jgi:hypothetical protein